MSQDVKLYIFQQIHTPSGNRLTGSYFCSVTGYDKQISFTALYIRICIYRIAQNSGGGKTLANQLFHSFGKENVGEFKL